MNHDSAPGDRLKNSPDLRARALQAEAEVARLHEQLAARDRLHDDLLKWARRLEARVAELSRGRRTVVDRAAMLADLPLRPTMAQKKAAAEKHGVKLHQVNKLLRERGTLVRMRRKFSRDF